MRDDWLADIPLLRGLGAAECRRLLDGAVPREYPHRTVLFHEGEQPDCLYVVLKGVVELYTEVAERIATAQFIFPPEAFLAAAALGDEPYLMSAATLGPASLLPLRADLLRAEAKRSPPFAHRLTLLLAGQYRTAMRHIIELKLRTGPQRVGAFLLRLIDLEGGDGHADLPVPKSALASKLGISPATASRAFNLLRHHGLTVRGSRIVIADRAALERFCGLDALLDGGDERLPVRSL